MFSILDCYIRDREYSLSYESLLDDWFYYQFIVGRADDYYLDCLSLGLLEGKGLTEVPFEAVTEVVRAMSPEEQLFADFFNRAYASAVNELSIDQIRERITALEKVAREAKASIRGYSKAESEKIARLSREDREKLLTHPDITVSDALAGVKRRQDKLTKKDDLKARLLGMVDEDTMNFLLGQVKVNDPAPVSKAKEANTGFYNSEAGAVVNLEGKTISIDKATQSAAPDKSLIESKVSTPKPVKLSKMDQAIQDMINSTKPKEIVIVEEHKAAFVEVVKTEEPTKPKIANPFTDLFK